MAADIEIAIATAEDIDGILDLQARNQPERGGVLSAPLSMSCCVSVAVGEVLTHAPQQTTGGPRPLERERRGGYEGMESRNT